MAEARANVVRIMGCDGLEVCVNVCVANMAGTIRSMDILNRHGGELDEEPIIFPIVTSCILKKVFTWCEYHRCDPEIEEEPIVSLDKRSDNLCQFDREFFDSLPQDNVFAIIRAADYLEVPGLLDAGCKTVANMIKGKAPDQIRTYFNLENNFTSEERAEALQDYNWTQSK